MEIERGGLMGLCDDILIMSFFFDLTLNPSPEERDFAATSEKIFSTFKHSNYLIYITWIESGGYNVIKYHRLEAAGTTTNNTTD